MEGLDLIPLSDTARARVASFAQQYGRFANIHMKVLEADDNSATIRVVQHYNKQNKYQDTKGLIDRVKDVFNGEVSEDYKIHVRAIPYTQHETDQVDLDWIRAKMDQYNLSQIDIVKALGVDKPTISKILAGRHELTRFQRAAFFFMFKNLKKREHLFQQ